MTSWNHVVVAGLGVTGRAVTGVLRARDIHVSTVDASGDADYSDQNTVDLRDVDLVVASPGWHPDSPLFSAVQAAGIRVVSEVELAWQLRVPSTRTGAPAPWLAVTGTNGKTTTVEMLESILTAAGEHTVAVGNVGRPLIESVIDPSYDVLALELSSYQLHFTYSMKAQASAILNVAMDHIDWHGSFEEYVAAKARIYSGVERAAIFPVGDKLIERAVREAEVTEGARAVGFTAGVPNRFEVGLVEDLMVDRAFHLSDADSAHAKQADELATIEDLRHLAGPDGSIPPHTVQNALAAATLARAHGVPAAAVSQGLRSFQTGRHRIELVADISGVSFVNDSKATNAHAAQASVMSFASGTVVWIAGGLAKGAAFDDLVVAVRDRVRAVVLIGVDSSELHGALHRHAPDIPVSVIEPDDTGTVMFRAVDAAVRIAQPGDVVLLAPAGASMDQFKNYGDRGDSFVSEVRKIADDPVSVP